MKTEYERDAGGRHKERKTIMSRSKKVLRLHGNHTIKLPDGKEIRIKRRKGGYQVVVNHGSYGLVIHSTDCMYMRWTSKDSNQNLMQVMVEDTDATRIKELLPPTALVVLDKAERCAVGLSAPTYSYPE